MEDFSWKGWLDFATCTECGRCQSQCPAWNTAKPLSPKLVMLALRDHSFAKAPVPPGRRRDRPGHRRGEAVRGGAGGVRARRPAGDAGGAAAAGRARGARRPGPADRRDHRPRGAVGLHDVRGVRGAVPGGHRARRPHRGHAPLPGDDRVRVPLRAGRAVPEPGEQGQPVGAEPEGPDGLGEGPATSRSRSSPTPSTRITSTCSGWAAPARSTTGRRRPPGRSRS